MTPAAIGLMSKEAFEDALRELPGWAQIDDIVKALDLNQFWGDDFLGKAVDMAKRMFVRRMAKSLKGSDGMPILASVVTKLEDGTEVRIYKQESLFDLADYEQVCAYHSERGRYHQRMAESYAKRAYERFGVQLTFGF